MKAQGRFVLKKLSAPVFGMVGLEIVANAAIKKKETFNVTATSDLLM